MNRPSVTGTIAVTDSLSLSRPSVSSTTTVANRFPREKIHWKCFEKYYRISFFFLFLSFSRLFLGIEGLDDYYPSTPSPSIRVGYSAGEDLP